MWSIMEDRRYIAIDLKSFYASVECVERGLDPLDALLTVADVSRTDATICLAVSPALKACGTGARPRLFQLRRRVAEANAVRLHGRTPRFLTTSAAVLRDNPDAGIDFIAATPRMALYQEYSHRINDIYRRFVAPEDMHVYSVDEVFIDVTPYLRAYRVSAHELAMKMIRTVLAETGITATAGVGTNLYLCKVAMDIVAKRMTPDRDGVRIAELDEKSYRRLLWEHQPLTDFWRVGPGVARRLAHYGIFTMGDIALCSVRGGEGLLYGLLGVNAELLIDHAWGVEPVTMAQIKAYRPEVRSLSVGQVLPRAYDNAEARVVVREMAETLALDLLHRRHVTAQVHFWASYDGSHSHTHGGARLPERSASVRVITAAILDIYDRVVDPRYPLKRLGLMAGGIVPDDTARRDTSAPVQLSLFDDNEAIMAAREARRLALERERSLLLAVLAIKERYGRNSILRGTNFCEGSTQRERNEQIGGHRK